VIVELTELIDHGRQAGHSSERIAEEIAHLIRDPRHAKAYSHPTRAQILKQLADGPASPVHMAGVLGIDLGCVSYHVRYLSRLGLIELASTRPRRGAVEHTYQLADA